MEHCRLWENTRKLAEKKGLEMEKYCPYDKICSGEVCIYLADPSPDNKQVKKFYSKLEKHNARKRI